MRRAVLVASRDRLKDEVDEQRDASELRRSNVGGRSPEWSHLGALSLFSSSCPYDRVCLPHTRGWSGSVPRTCSNDTGIPLKLPTRPLGPGKLRQSLFPLDQRHLPSMPAINSHTRLSSSSVYTCSPQSWIGNDKAEPLQDQRSKIVRTYPRGLTIDHLTGKLP